MMALRMPTYSVVTNIKVAWVRVGLVMDADCVNMILVCLGIGCGACLCCAA
jgi:hypothetical protein